MDAISLMEGRRRGTGTGSMDLFGPVDYRPRPARRADWSDGGDGGDGGDSGGGGGGDNSGGGGDTGGGGGGGGDVGAQAYADAVAAAQAGGLQQAGAGPGAYEVFFPSGGGGGGGGGGTAYGSAGQQLSIDPNTGAITDGSGRILGYTQPPTPTYDSIDPYTRSTFDSYAQQIGYPGGGRALWEQQNASQGTAPTLPAPPPSTALTWNNIDEATRELFNSTAAGMNYPGGGQALWEKQNADAQGSGQQGNGFALNAKVMAQLGTQTWDTLDQQTRDLFNAQANSIGYPGGGQALWQYQNAQNAVKSVAPTNAVSTGQNWFTLDQQTRDLFNAQASSVGYPGGGQALWQYQNDHPTQAGVSAVGGLAMNDPQRAKLAAAGFTGNGQFTGAYDPRLTQAAYDTISQKAQSDARQQQLAQQGRDLVNAQVQSAQNAQRLSAIQPLLSSSLLTSGLGAGLLGPINAALTGAGLPGIPGSAIQDQQDQLKNQQQTAFAQSLLSTLNGPMGPGELPVVNAALKALGLPGIGADNGDNGPGVMANGITPAMWDQMPDAAKQLILLAWQARGGQQQDFLNAIDAQRPQGTRSIPSRVQFAPLAA